jgi:hypothetical protein
MSVPLPPVNVPYTRSLLNEVKLGKGKGLKQLRDELAARPDIKQRFLVERAIEDSNEKQRRSMMWVKDASSRVGRVKSEFREACAYTNPMGNNEVPSRRGVAQHKEQQRIKHLFDAPEAKATAL